jgi:hypothetical protein
MMEGSVSFLCIFSKDRVSRKCERGAKSTGANLQIFELRTENQLTVTKKGHTCYNPRKQGEVDEKCWLSSHNFNFSFYHNNNIIILIINRKIPNLFGVFFGFVFAFIIIITIITITLKTHQQQPVTRK